MGVAARAGGGRWIPWPRNPSASTFETVIQEQTAGLYLSSPSGDVFTNPLFLISACFAVRPCPASSELPLVGGRSVEVWISPDPARQFASPYAYGPGNPVNGSDPDGAVWKTISRTGGNGVGHYLTNFFGLFDEDNGKIGLTIDNYSNYKTLKVTQRWEHSSNDPDAVNHLHPSGATRQFSQTMEPMNKVLRALKDIENSNSFLYGAESAWYPPIPNFTYWEMADAPHFLNGQSISPSTPSNPNVEIGPVDVCSGCPWFD